MYGMRRTTIYIPEELKDELEHTARTTGRSEADLIRDGLRLVLERTTPPPPTLPLFASGQPDLAERVDELLEGFGER